MPRAGLKSRCQHVIDKAILVTDRLKGVFDHVGVALNKETWFPTKKYQLNNEISFLCDDEWGYIVEPFVRGSSIKPYHGAQHLHGAEDGGIL